MNRASICERIERTGIIPIVRTPSAESAALVARAILAAGIDVVEITMNVPGVLDLVRQLRREVGNDVVLGAGTVLDAATARACIQAGAEFIVAPGTDVETIHAAHAWDKPCMPGALTPTEVIAAWRAGADVVKIFPCSAVGGAAYVRALKAPLPQIKMLPTGGVDVTSAADFIKAGASVLGVGAGVSDLKAFTATTPAALAERCRKILDVVQAARASGD